MTEQSTSTGEENRPSTISATSMTFDLDMTEIGPQYRRAGDPNQQRTYYFAGGQSMTYGPQDQIPDYQEHDAFFHQFAAVDAHREFLAVIMPRNGVANGVE